MKKPGDAEDPVLFTVTERTAKRLVLGLVLYVVLRFAYTAWTEPPAPPPPAPPAAREVRF